MKWYFVRIIALVLVSVPLIAQETGWTAKSMMAFKRVGTGGTAVSPDGARIAYTIATPVMEGEKSEFLTHIWLVSSDGKTNVPYTSGEKSCTNPAFSPDGKYLAFLSSRGKDSKNQIFTLRVAGGEAEQITQSKSGVNGFKWSSDGKRFCYIATDPQSDKQEKDYKEKRDMRVVDADVRYDHLHIVEFSKNAKGERSAKRLTAGKLHVTSFDWSPDGKTIAFAHQTTPSVNDWVTTDIALVSSDSSAVKPLVQWKGSDAGPRFSPDGKTIAFSSDENDPRWASATNMYLISVEGGKPQKLASTPDESAGIVTWSPDGKFLYCSEPHRTMQRVYALPTSGKEPQVLVNKTGDRLGLISGVSFSTNGKTCAFVSAAPEAAPDVYVATAPDFKPQKLTDVHTDFLKAPMGKTEVLTWKSKDGKEIEGLLTYPMGYQQGKKYPLILNIHGGPAGVFSQNFTGSSAVYPLQAFAQAGYAVLRPNPRGSGGYGKAFRQANMNDWGGGDYEDIMAGVDKTIEMGVAHPDSLCVTGWSYGGYMTSTIITKTKRFKAAMVGAGVTNLMSFNGTADIPAFVPDYFGGEFWDKEEMYRKHSAMFNIRGVNTPTLIIHGEADVRVPVSQGYELYNALKRQGTKTEMVVYPRTPHGPQEPKFIQDIGERVLEWFNAHLGRDLRGGGTR